MASLIKKIEIAQIQLDAAIRSLFEDEHLVVVHTLAGPAARIVSDLVQQAKPDQAWHNMACEANKIGKKEYFNIIRSDSNELKHADRNPIAMENLDSQNVELSIWIAIYDLGTLGARTEIFDIYELWCLSRHSKIFNTEDFAEILAVSRNFFGDLSKSPRNEALLVALLHKSDVARTFPRPRRIYPTAIV